MSLAVLSAGSNLGDRVANLRLAIAHVRPWLTAVSPVYETPPWGPVPQDDFFNVVLIVDDPDAGARDWLARAQAAERAAGRVRELRWGPRSLDVDVIDVDGIESDEPDLTLPHPRAAERAFVLVPWLAVAPEATLGTVRIAELLAALPASERAGVRERPEARLGR